VTQTPPGATSVFQFKAMKPGVFVVEPPGGLSKVDKEFYVMQGDIYLKGDPAQSGVHEAAVDKMEKAPDFVVFNGSVESLAKERALKAKVGETVRIFFGNAGPKPCRAFTSSVRSSTRSIPQQCAVYPGPSRWSDDGRI
jgi:nitrite reductase (NO-forming)